MKRILFSFLFMTCASQVNAQAIYRCFIKISYDAAGNRTQREWVCQTVVDPLPGDSDGDGILDIYDDTYNDNDGGDSQRPKTIPATTIPTAWSKKLYPNPSTGKFTIEFSKTIEAGILAIYTTTGKLILEEKLQDANAVITQLSNYSAGVYLVKVTETSTGKTEIIKLIKQD
jgi:hypothetical protein